MLIFFCQIFFVLFDRAGFLNLRQSFLKAMILVSVFIVFSTEILSVFTALNSSVVIAWWFTGNLVLSAHIFFFVRRRLNILSIFREAVRSRIEWFSTAAAKIYFSLLFLVYSTVLSIAVLSPPNTSDSLSYHLARVANWIQTGSVEFYPTAILRQLYQPPLAEYIILHLQLLTGDDRCANLVQFFCFAACGVAASLIVREFRQDNLTQTLAALLTATVPMAILQGSSTQNDLVVSLFVLSFFHFFLKAGKSLDGMDFGFAGLSLGAAILSKGTAYIFCFPIGILIFGGIFSYRSAGKKLKFAGLTLAVLMLAFSINAGHYSRNYRLFGSVVSSGEDQVANSNISLPLIGSTIARNYLVHFGTNSMPINESINAFAGELLGSELNNPDSTYLERPFAVIYSEQEDSAGNLLHILLLTGNLIFAVFYRGKKKNLMIAALGIVAGFLLFCGLLRWQPWASRLHLPLFMLGATVTAVMLSKLSFRTTVLLAVLCFLGSLPFLLYGQPRSLISNNNLSVLSAPRLKLYFANNPSIMPAFLEAAAVVKEAKAEEVGLALTVDYQNYACGDWEYPLWVLLKNQPDDTPHLRHVGVKNISDKLDQHSTPPEWIISADSENVIEGVQYDEIWNKKPFRILRKHSAGQQ